MLFSLNCWKCLKRVSVAGPSSFPLFPLNSAGIWFQPISFVLSCFVSFAPYQDFYLLSCFVFFGLIELWLSLPYRAFLFSHALILFWYFVQNQSVSPSCSTICSTFLHVWNMSHVFFFTCVSVLGNGSITALFFVMGGPTTPVLNSSVIFFHRTVGCSHNSVHLLSSLCGTGREVVLRFIQQGVLLVLVCEPRPSGKDGWNASTAYRDRRMGDGGRRAALEGWRWSVEP